VHQVSHPHHQHSHEHEYYRNHVLKHPGARVSHEVESALVQQSDQVPPEVGELSFLIVLLSQVRVAVMRQFLMRLIDDEYSTCTCSQPKQSSTIICFVSKSYYFYGLSEYLAKVRDWHDLVSCPSLRVFHLILRIYINQT
jgi:hypothetical protein